MMKFREPVGETFTAAIAGDFCPREVNSAETAAHAEEIVKDILPFYRQADLRLLQMENAVTSGGTPIVKSGPNHRCSVEAAVNFSRALDAQILLLANNHTGDYGPEAVMETIENCRQAGFATVGAGANAEEAAEALIVEVKGMQLAILNYCENEFGIARRNTPGAAGIDLPEILAHVRELKKQGFLVLVTLHGGHETYPYPSPRMVKLFRAIADGGADAVFNCHTHCPLGSEIHNGVPIVGSCGNFYFPPKDSRVHRMPLWHLGYLPLFSFDSKGAWQLELIPYYNEYLRIRLLPAEEMDDFKAFFKDLCRPFEDMALCEELFDSWCFPEEPSSYFKLLFEAVYPENWSSDESVSDNIRFRNLLNCESHCDLLKNCFLIIEQRRTASAGKRRSEINAARFPGWLKVDSNESK